MGFWLALNAKHEMGCEWKWAEAVWIADCKVATFLWLFIGKVCFYRDKSCFTELTRCSLAIANISHMFGVEMFPAVPFPGAGRCCQ